ncbi:hypothetical protein BH11BAC4_BH11BAC4_27550 [soil metagenome]
MKTGILYFFLFTYSTVMLKPVMPYATDFMAHLLFFKDHMATVHAHHGKFHAHASMAEGAKDDQSEKTTNNFKKANLGFDHVIMDSYRLPVQLTSKKDFYPFTISCATRDLQHDYPPPRA